MLVCNIRSLGSNFGHAHKLEQIVVNTASCTTPENKVNGGGCVPSCLRWFRKQDNINVMKMFYSNQSFSLKCLKCCVSHIKGAMVCL